MKRIEYKSGQVIGECIFLKELPRLIQPSGQPKRMGRFKCECGNSFDATIDNVRRKHTVSCGCLQKLTTSRVKTVHGMSKSRLYDRWSSMKQRCCDPKHKTYYAYGARGITVCEEWKNSFNAFMEWCLENGYRESLELDRIDNNKGYSPSNCRWVTRNENIQNQRHKTGGTSEFIGVSKTRHGKWVAKLSKDKVEYYLGTFDNEEDAAIAVNAAIDRLETKHIKNVIPRSDHDVS